MPWRTRIWDERFDAATKAEFRDAAARHNERRRALNAAKLIDTSAFAAQEGSNFLSLPPEIRNVIYEYVFGHGTIHLTQRRCTATDNISLHWSGPFTRVTSINDDGHPKHQPYVQYQKSTYSVCRYPGEWETAYSLSRKSLAETNTPANAVLDVGVAENGPSRRKLRAYPHRHTVCTIPTFEMHEQKYLPICAEQDMNFHYGDICGKCDLPGKREYLTDRYGPPSVGLKKLHANSALNLDVLQTCKEIYHEASLLPYSLYEFDASSPRRGLEFAKLLTPRQRRAIERVHVQSVCETADDFKMVVRAFPNLQVLHQTRHARSYKDPTTKYTRGWAGYFRSHNLKQVQIITGYDGDKADGVDRRAQRFEYSRAYERFLVSKSLEKGIAIANEYKQAGGELCWEIPEPENTNEAAQSHEHLLDRLSSDSSDADMV